MPKPAHAVRFGSGIFPHAFAPTHVWKFDDPTDKSIDQVRALRDDIRTSVENLIAEIEKEETNLALDQIILTPMQLGWN